MPRGRPLEVERELLEGFERSGAATGHLVGTVPETIWRAAPPSGRGRTIAGIVAHMQSVRRTFGRMGGAKPGPPSLDGKRATRLQAQRALAQSTRDLTKLFEAAIEARRPRVPGQPRRVVDMLLYLLQHDAHHRGQICLLAKDLGHEFRDADNTYLWGWRKTAG